MNGFIASHDRITGYVLAVLIHGSFFFLGNKMFYSPAEYGINAQMSSVEVNLVAAPVAFVETPPEAIHKEISKKEALPKQKVMVHSKDEMNEPSNEERIEQKPKSSRIHGDGSSPVPGHDAITFHSVGATQRIASADFAENLAPPYPERAKEMKQQGLVILMVQVDATGHPIEMNIKQSSGYFLLDEAAVKAVKHWKFRPARVGGVAVESTTEVPIRFRLEN